MPPLRPSSDDPWRRSLVAERDGVAVGTATIALAAVTDTYFCEVHVTEPLRRQGIGTELYRAACTAAARPLPVIGRAMGSQPLRRQFAESIGCEVAVHCPEPWADPTTEPWRRWIDEHPVPAGYRVAPVREHDPAAVEAAWSSYFTWSHTPFGDVRTERLPQAWLRYSAGLDRDLSMVASDAHGQPVALSLVSPDVWDGRTLVVSETVQRDQPAGTTLLQAVVAASLRVLGQRGTRLVELEGHSTDTHSPELVASLPPHEADPMDLLRLRRLPGTPAAVGAGR
ncbi:Acetyltransferase (GNAT) family protein [Auraticoccus monumenti]|uniref:Acetyltransferase (GNAT) family protein n=1 Tax=Auraticoccus monumenti TaxID=675864 RepID=A0A1G6SVB6_9ACTN|nr:Acetyltransferase (GNAT) family protein [Auraticoccus monumenti]